MIPRRFRAVCLLVAVLGLVGSACSGGGASGPASGLVLADQQGLSLFRLEDASRRLLVSFNDGSYLLDPAVSPDGRRIAFARQPPARQRADGTLDFGSDLYVADADGKNLRELVRHSQVAEFILSTAWLSNNELLFEVRGRTAGGQADLRIEKLDVSSKSRTRFIDNALDPAVSPDGRLIAYAAIDPNTQEDLLVLATADLRDRRTLVEPGRNLALFSAMVFSPDSNRIAFAAVDLNPPALQPGSRSPAGSGPGQAFPLAVHPFAQDIWLVNRDGSGLHRASDLAENMPSIAFAGSDTLLLVLGGSGFWRIDLAGSAVEQVGEGAIGQIAWFP
jgi:Tol biopolymer transport system component